MAKFDLYYPCKPYRVNQNFGENANTFYASLGMLGHNGIDIFAPTGTIIRASHDGTVTYAGGEQKEGIGVTIVTDKEYDYKGGQAYYKTIYWHLLSVAVKYGQKVRAGDVVGYADNTGMSTGSHLHIGLKPCTKQGDFIIENLEQNNGFFGSIDPAPYWNGIYAEVIIGVMAKLELLKQKLAELVAAFSRIKK